MTSQATGAGQQRPDLQAGAALEEAGEPVAHRPPRGDCFRRHRTRPARLAFDRGPGFDPVVVVLAIFFAVAAVGQRGLPVVDPLPEGRVVGVVFGAEVLVRGFIAGKALRRRLAEEFGDFGVGFRLDDPVHPHVHAIGMLGLRADHPGVRPAGRALLGQEALAGGAGGDRLAFALQGEVLVLPGGADADVAVGEGRDLLRGFGPVFADVGALFLQQVDRRVRTVLRSARRGFRSPGRAGGT